MENIKLTKEQKQILKDINKGKQLFRKFGMQKINYYLEKKKIKDSIFNEIRNNGLIEFSYMTLGTLLKPIVKIYYQITEKGLEFLKLK